MFLNKVQMLPREGSEIVGNTRKEIEKKTGKSIISSKNARQQLSSSDTESDDESKSHTSE